MKSEIEIKGIYKDTLKDFEKLYMDRADPHYVDYMTGRVEVLEEILNLDKTETISIELNDNTMKHLRKLSDEEDLPMSFIVTNLLMEHLKELENDKKEEQTI